MVSFPATKPLPDIMDSGQIVSHRLGHDARQDQATRKDQSESLSDPNVRHNRQCWHCLRRRLVCDFLRPGCGKCSAAGIVCPGYDDKKPVTWLAPGQVLSRTRRPQESKRLLTNTNLKNNVEVREEMVDEALQRVVQVRSVAFKTDACDIVEALYYYNHQVYPTLLSNQLAPSPFVVPFEVVHLLPTSLNHALTSMALSHRILKLPRDAGRVDLKHMLCRLYHHVGIAIRALNKEIDQPATRTSDGTMASVIIILFAELQQSTTPMWRVHVSGLTKLIMLRGGLEKLVRSAPYAQPAMLAFLILSISANATSPSSDLIEPTSHLRIIDLITELYQIGVYPSFPCPSHLFLDIIKINYLRFQATNITLANNTTEIAAGEVLFHVQSFSSEDWAESQGSLMDEWLLIARIYQCAVTLYGISSLHRLTIAASDHALKVLKTVQRKRLFSMLEVGLLNPRTKNCMMWPLVVAGVEAARGSVAERAFVAEYLLDMSQELGSSRPLVAKMLFERFWSSGKTGWDDCFDRPCALA